MKYKISELASLLNVSTNTIRRYENKGYIHSEPVTSTNYHYFDEINATKFMDVRLLRKFEFSHEEIDTIMKSNWDKTLLIYRNKVNELDSIIQYYTYLKDRLNGNINLLEKMSQTGGNGYFRDCVPFSYILYQQGDVLLKEAERLNTIQNFLYTSPCVYRIYMARKEDIVRGNPEIFTGCAIKTVDFEAFHLTESPYIEKYPRQPSYVSFIKVPLSANLQSLSNHKLIISTYLDTTISELKENGLQVSDDMIALVISDIFEEDEQMQYILVNIPVAQAQ